MKKVSKIQLGKECVGVLLIYRKEILDLDNTHLVVL